MNSFAIAYAYLAGAWEPLVPGPPGSRGARNVIQPFPWLMTDECAFRVELCLLCVEKCLLCGTEQCLQCATEQRLLYWCSVILTIWGICYNKHNAKFLTSAKQPTNRTASRFSNRAQLKLLASKHRAKAGPNHISTHTVATGPSYT
jgi:hypothetical protein